MMSVLAQFVAFGGTAMDWAATFHARDDARRMTYSVCTSTSFGGTVEHISTVECTALHGDKNVGSTTQARYG